MEILENLGVRKSITVAKEEYRISIRNGWSIALTFLFGILSLLLVFFGGSRVGPTDFEAFIVSLLSLATYLLPLASLVYGYDLVSGEESKLGPVFALPVSRETIILGKYLGRGFSLLGATLIGFGIAGLALLTKTGLDPIMYVYFIGASILLSLSFLSVSCLISILAPNKPYSLGGCLVAWLWFILIHDLISIGVISSFDLPDIFLSILIFLNPADIFRVMIFTLINTTGGGLSAIFTNIDVPIFLLILGMIVWCIVPILVGSKIIYSKSI